MFHTVCASVNVKKVTNPFLPPVSFVDISAMRADYCMKFYVTVKQSDTHFTTKSH